MRASVDGWRQACVAQASPPAPVLPLSPQRYGRLRSELSPVRRFAGTAERRRRGARGRGGGLGACGATCRGRPAKGAERKRGRTSSTGCVPAPPLHRTRRSLPSPPVSFLQPWATPEMACGERLSLRTESRKRRACASEATGCRAACPPPPARSCRKPKARENVGGSKGRVVRLQVGKRAVVQRSKIATTAKE